MPHARHPHQIEAERLLQDYLSCIHAASRVVDHETFTRDDHRVAVERLRARQAQLIDLIAAGLASGDVLF